MTNTTQEPGQLIRCSICRGEHPRRLSALVESTGQAAGLECLTPELRSLLGLPSPEEAEALPDEKPPSLKGRKYRPSKYFLVSMDFGDANGFKAEHFRQALNLIGLYEVLRAGTGMNPRGTTIISGNAGTETEFFTSPYLSPQGDLQVWMEAHAPGGPDGLPLAAARLSWSRNNSPGAEEFHRRARELLESADRATGRQDPE